MITSHQIELIANCANNVNNLVAFKNEYGIEFIGTFVDDGNSLADDVAQFSKVRMMNIQPQPDGTILGSLIPYSNCNPDGTLTFSTNSIVAVYTPIADVEKDYMTSTLSISLSGA